MTQQCEASFRSVSRGNLTHIMFLQLKTRRSWCSSTHRWGPVKPQEEGLLQTVARRNKLALCLYPPTPISEFCNDYNINNLSLVAVSLKYRDEIEHRRSYLHHSPKRWMFLCYKLLQFMVQEVNTPEVDLVMLHHGLPLG